VHTWADKYDGTLNDIFDLQDRITEHVAGALQPSIRQAEIERARRKELGAYDYTMRAMRHVWPLEKEAAVRGLELLDQALKIDGDYPLGLALAAWYWAQRSVYNWVDDMAAAKAQALKLADRGKPLG
jgi:adenylate cyclase